MRRNPTSTPSLPQRLLLAVPLLFSLLFPSLFLAAGCTDDGRQPEADAEADPDRRPDAGLLEPHQQAIERARGVEDNLADAAARQRERIEDEGG